MEVICAERLSRDEMLPLFVDTQDDIQVASIREDILDLFNDLFKNRQILTLSLSTSQELLNSVLFKVDAQNGYFYLDEVVPRAAANFIQPNTHVLFGTSLNGMLVSFTARVKSIDIEDGLPIYQFAFPCGIDYKPRREHSRLTQLSPSPIEIHLLSAQKKFITCRLVNLSLGGLCFELTRGAARGMEIGDIIPQCTIGIPQLRQIITRVQIRNFSDLHGQNKRRFGGRFIALSRRDQNDLLQYIHSVDYPVNTFLPT